MITPLIAAALFAVAPSLSSDNSQVLDMLSDADLSDVRGERAAVSFANSLRLEASLTPARLSVDGVRTVLSDYGDRSVNQAETSIALSVVVVLAAPFP